MYGASRGGCRTCPCSSRTVRPLNRSTSSTRARSQGWSAAPRNEGTSRPASTNAGMRFSGSKRPPPSVRRAHLVGVAHHELVDRRALARPWAQEASDALDVLAFAAGTGDDDPDLGVRHVDSFIEDLRRHERPQLAVAKTREHALALLAANVTGQRHDQMLAGDGVGSLIVAGEHQRPLFPMARQEHADQIAFAARKC